MLVLVNRATAYGMEVSTDKSQIMTNSTNNISANISMNGQKLEEVWLVHSTCHDSLSKPAFRAPWRVGDAVVGIGNTG